MEHMKRLQRLLLAAVVCLAQTSLWAVTEINVETAGTLQSLLTETEQELKKLTKQEFRWLMEGLSIVQKKAFEPGRPCTVC